MAASSTSPSSAAGEELLITRVFDAPRPLVWKALSEQERLARWWGPKGSTIRVARHEFRPRGLFHYSMRMPDGSDLWGRFVYLEIQPPGRIVFVNAFADAQGNIGRNPWAAVWPLEIHNTLTLEAAGDRTTLTLRGSPQWASEAEWNAFVQARASMQQGFGGSFDQLGAHLASMKAAGEK